jgi:hypothetical protein
VGILDRQQRNVVVVAVIKPVQPCKSRSYLTR